MTASSRTIEHVGEWRVELRADTLPELFGELARVIASAAGPSVGDYGQWEDIDVTARDHEALLVDCANELISRCEIAGRAYDDMERAVVLEGPQPTFRARVRSRPVTTWRSPVKAATYHGVELVREGQGWRATVLFDI